MTEPSTISFNLVENPCVPVLDLQNRPQTLSLRDALINAHQLREIQHGSPVVTASLVRLFVAVLTDICLLEFSRQWKALWAEKSFDANAIDAYFQKYHNRFDLFHETYPFYQCAALEDDNPVNLNLFACELSSGNNSTLFDHSLDTIEQNYSPIEAFHLLLATQNFALAGLLRRTTRLKGETEPFYWQNAYGGPLIPGAMIWLTGDNLFKTLCLNLVPLGKLPEEEDKDLEESEMDRPIWRQDKPEALRDRKGHNKFSPLGTRDRLTFQCRLIRLLPQIEEGAIVVRRAAYNHGRSLDATVQGSFDPMLAYREGKKEGVLVVHLSAEKAAWRDVHALIGRNQKVDGKVVKHVPRALLLLHNALEDKVPDLREDSILRLNVAGLANDPKRVAKILLWRHDRVDAPAKVLCNPDVADRVASLLSEAEEIGYALRTTTHRFCEIFLAPLSIGPDGKPVEGAMKADPDRVTALANTIDPRPAYWARLESAFHRLLLELVENADAASNNWKDHVEKEARLAFDEAVICLGDSPQTGKAAALVNSYFVVPSRQTKPAVSVGNRANTKPKEKSA